MSYTTITLGPLAKDENGNDIPGSNTRHLKFNNLALEIMGKLNGTGELTAFNYSVIYGGMRGWSYAKMKEPDYTFEEVIDWIDAALPDEKSEMTKRSMAALNETQLWLDAVSAGKELLEKKSDPEAMEQPTA